jgi:hypothetical protein
MKFYRKHSETNNYPYLDNCYYALGKRNDLDVEVTNDPDLFKTFWQVGQLDFKKARVFSKNWMDNEGGFNSLNDGDKLKACWWFIPTTTEALTFYQEQGYTAEEALNIRVGDSIIFNQYSMKSRRTRYDASSIYLRNFLNSTDLNLVGQDIITYQLEITYVEYGREGTMKTNYDGVPDQLGMFDYVTGSQNWIDAGHPTFSSRITTPLHGVIIQDIINKLMQILDEGIY